MSETNQQPPQPSNLVLVLSIIGLVFGSMGTMGSFVPCLGMLAVYVAIPGAIISILALIIAKVKSASLTLPVIALTLSLLGAGVSIFQTASISAGINHANDQVIKEYGTQL